MSRSEQFPLVGDDEVFIHMPPAMDLYDDGDLITNITGSYQDRQYAADPFTPAKRPEAGPSRPPQDSQHSQPSRQVQKPQPPVRPAEPAAEPSYGQLAREQAREDLKRKRAASYLIQKKPFQSKELPKPKPSQRDLDRAKLAPLSLAADRLRQEDYIIAELRPTYQPPDNPPIEAKKNSYDFLKTSQVYNYQDNRPGKAKPPSQELNLTRFEQRDTL